MGIGIYKSLLFKEFLMNNQRIINFQVPETLVKRIEEVKIKQDRSLASIARLAITKYCDEVLKR